MNQNQKLTGTEAKIIRSRLKGNPFYELSDAEIRLATDKIMIRGAAICGCALPITEGFAQIISNELYVFINEFGYCSLTLSEVILALHLNAMGGLRYADGSSVERIEFTGICFNVVYIAKILQIYALLRNGLDRKFINQIDGY